MTDLSQPDKMLLMTEALDVRLFVDQRGNPYIVIPDEVGDKIYKLRTRYVRTWLASLLWDSEQKAPGSEALQKALNILEAKAHKEFPLKLYNRVAPDGLGGIYVDMCNDYWQAIHITKKGWEIVDRPPILFRRYTHQKALPTPLKYGSVFPLLELINLKPSNPNGNHDATLRYDAKNDGGGSFSRSHLLYLVSLISYFIPNIPHPLLIFHGQHGSGKSIAHKITREFVDPSSTPVLTMPRKENELLQVLDHHYFPVFDNVSTLPDWISDMLCRAVSGSGSSKRRLYTDDEDEIYEFYRCIGINGINIAAERGDLLDRCVLHGLKEIKSKDRLTEKDIFKKIEEAKGEVFGGILDVLTIALRLYDKVELKDLYRMADFTKWGYAITWAMGLDPKDFIKEYKKNINSQRLEAVSSDPVADVLDAFILSKIGKEWNGTASQLLTGLNAIAKEMSISITQRAWPKSPTHLSKRINTLIPNLPLIGLKVERPRARIISIKSVSSVPASSSVKVDSYFNAEDDENEEQSNKVDIDLLYSGKSRSQTMQLQIVLSLISEMECVTGTVKDEELYDSLMQDKGISRIEVARLIGILMRDGTIFAPRPGYYKRTN